MFVFFTELIARGVYDRHHRWVGRPYDFCVRPQEAYPPCTGLVVAQAAWRDRYACIPWDQVQVAEGNGHGGPVFQLRGAVEQLTYAPLASFGTEFRLRRNVLDQQVVDTFNRKVVRVNDIHLFRVDNDFRVAHVDVGLRGIVRRLGWTPVVDRLVRLVAPHATYLTREGFIGWKYIQPLAIHPEKGTLPLTVPQQELHRIPPADLSEILLELDPYQRVALFKALDAPTQGNILSEMELRFQRELIAQLDTKTAVEVFERMPSDEGADLLQAMSRREADRILSIMTSRKAKKLSQLLAHKSRSAGGLMTTEFITLAKPLTVAEAIAQIRAMTGRVETVNVQGLASPPPVAKPLEPPPHARMARWVDSNGLRGLPSVARLPVGIYEAYVIDDDLRLEGVVTFRDLLVADPLQPLTAVMTARPIAVQVDASAKEVAYVLDKYNLFAVPVIDEGRVVQGIITIDDVLSLVIAETWGKKTGLM